MENWAVLYNPKAGRYSSARLEAILRGLHAEGIQTRVQESKYPGHLRELVQQVRGVTRVAVMGGDGSFNEAANGLLGRQLPLICLPGGTANVLARELNIPLQTRKIAPAVARMRVIKVRPGSLNGRAFLLMASFGYDARVVHATRRWQKQWLGVGSYVLQGLREFLSPKISFSWQVHTKSAQPSSPPSPQRQSVWLIACRAKRYAGPFIIHSQAGLLKPQLVFVAAPLGHLTAMLLKIFVPLKQNTTKFSQYQLGNYCTINSETPLAAQLDGEAIPPQHQFQITPSSKTIFMGIA